MTKWPSRGASRPTSSGLGAETRSSAYADALTLLTRRALSCTECRDRLLARQHPEDKVDEAIAKGCKYLINSGQGMGTFPHGQRNQPQAMQAASAPCTPECSPGYTCLDGRCLSQCNPACDAGQRCGADRLCHHVQ